MKLKLQDGKKPTMLRAEERAFQVEGTASRNSQDETDDERVAREGRAVGRRL